MVEKLKAILNTLDEISVKGHENVQKMYAVQQYINRMIMDEMQATEKAAEEPEK